MTMAFLEKAFVLIGDLTWGWALVPLLVVLGLFFTAGSGFVQFRFFTRMFRVLFKANQSTKAGAITARQALLLSVGGRVGGGNIAGVAVAISLGGPGAVFWMWAIATVGMGTSLVECSIAQLFKEPTEQSGVYRGGPARSIICGLGTDFRWLALLYAVCLLAAFGIGFPAFQGNIVAGAVEDSLGVSRIITGMCLAAVTAFIVWGGIHRISNVSDVIVPIMALIYLALAVLVILNNLGAVPGVLKSIIANAFGLEEAVSGGMGAALAQGLRRGLFSNEAGLGSVPNVAATADVQHPVSQGITQSFSVFIDTFLICSCTAFVILLGDIYQAGAEGVDGVALTQQSLVSHLGEWSQYFLTIAITLFAFSTIIYNYYLGENAVSVISKSKAALQLFRGVLVGIVLLGAVAPAATSIFFFSDPLMGVLAVVNLLALTMLFPIAKRLIADFTGQLKAGIETPVLNPDDYSDLKISRSVWKGWSQDHHAR